MLRCLFPSVLIVFLSSAPTAATSSDEDASNKTYTPTSAHTQQEIEGWTVYVHPELLEEKAELGERTLRLLRSKLFEIAQQVPAKALAELREVPIWVGLEDRHGRHPCACYHPSERWLRGHGYNPDKARSVDIANARNFVRWSRTQPSMVLHELAHAYHDRVIGHGHEQLQAAYERAKESGKYDSVMHYNGRDVRHYALNNAQEYFAEATEAYFGVNDFYPFVRPELREHDPRGYELIRKLWGD